MLLDRIATILEAGLPEGPFTGEYSAWTTLNRNRYETVHTGTNCTAGMVGHPNRLRQRDFEGGAAELARTPERHRPQLCSCWDDEVVSIQPITRAVIAAESILDARRVTDAKVVDVDEAAHIVMQLQTLIVRLARWTSTNLSDYVVPATAALGTLAGIVPCDAAQDESMVIAVDGVFDGTDAEMFLTSASTWALDGAKLLYVTSVGKLASHMHMATHPLPPGCGDQQAILDIAVRLWSPRENSPMAHASNALDAAADLAVAR